MSSRSSGNPSAKVSLIIGAVMLWAVGTVVGGGINIFLAAGTLSRSIIWVQPIILKLSLSYAVVGGLGGYVARRLGCRPVLIVLAMFVAGMAAPVLGELLFYCLTNLIGRPTWCNDRLIVCFQDMYVSVSAASALLVVTILSVVHSAISRRFK